MHGNNSIKKYFLPYEQTVEFLKLSIEFNALAHYHTAVKEEHIKEYGLEPFFVLMPNWNTGCTILPVPLYEQAFDFFEKKYDLYKNIIKSASGCILHISIGTSVIYSVTHKTKEDALLEGIKELIRTVNKKRT